MLHMHHVSAGISDRNADLRVNIKTWLKTDRLQYFTMCFSLFPIITWQPVYLSLNKRKKLISTFIVNVWPFATDNLILSPIIRAKLSYIVELHQVILSIKMERQPQEPLRFHNLHENDITEIAIRWRHKSEVPFSGDEVLVRSLIEKKRKRIEE